MTKVFDAFLYFSKREYSKSETKQNRNKNKLESIQSESTNQDSSSHYQHFYELKKDIYSSSSQVQYPIAQEIHNFSAHPNNGQIFHHHHLQQQQSNLIQMNQQVSDQMMVNTNQDYGYYGYNSYYNNCLAQNSI
jgi:hypothetical protein